MGRNVAIVLAGLVTVLSLGLCTAGAATASAVKAVSSPASSGASTNFRRSDMATKKQGPRNERTKTSDAGKPVVSPEEATRDVRSRPSDEELDRRDRMKSGPRRPAGPPLPGDTPEPEATRALPDEALNPPTDPE